MLLSPKQDIRIRILRCTLSIDVKTWYTRAFPWVNARYYQLLSLTGVFWFDFEF